MTRRIQGNVWICCYSPLSVYEEYDEHENLITTPDPLFLKRFDTKDEAGAVLSQMADVYEKQHDSFFRI